MKYLIFGMGGVGASIAERLISQGKDVSVIARGNHLEALQQRGLIIERTFSDDNTIAIPHATTAEEYADTPDVVFICTKGYSLESSFPLIERCGTKDTVVISLLNLYGTGQQLSAHFQNTMGENAPLCPDGCIYVSAELAGPGILLETGPLCRVVFGLPFVDSQPEVLKAIAADATGGSLECDLSDDIRRDAFKKFSYVSPMGAAAIIHHSNAGDVQAESPARQTFIEAMQEVVAIGKAMGIDVGNDIIEVNLALAGKLDPSAKTSMQRDIEAGRQSEFDGLISEVIRLGKQYGIPTPIYDRAANSCN